MSLVIDKNKLDILRADLDEYIFEEEKIGYPVHETSWGGMRGILLSVQEVKDILEILNFVHENNLIK